MKESFLLYHSFRKPASLLSMEDRGRLWDAIFEYQCDGKEPELPGALGMAFAFIRNQFERDQEKWESTIEARREAGRLGGLSRAKHLQANQANAKFAKQIKQSQANQAVSVTDTVSVDKKKNIKKKFQKPTIDEIKQYCEERKNGIDPEQFYDHYETSGWKRGKTHVKDWKACIRTWERNSTQENSDMLKMREF